jgi:hypothetical protein
MLGGMGTIEGVTVTFDGANHSYTLTMNSSQPAGTDSEFAEIGYQINQKRNKLKLSDMLIGPDIIFAKQ